MRRCEGLRCRGTVLGLLHYCPACLAVQDKDPAVFDRWVAASKAVAGAKNVAKEVWDEHLAAWEAFKAVRNG